MSNPIELKIKALSLGDEIKEIKFEEKQLLRLQRRYLQSKYRAKLIAEQRDQEAQKGDIWGSSHYSIRKHRYDVVKPEARATNIARGFLKGLPYEVVETYPKDVGNSKTNYLLSKRRTDGHAWEGPRWDRVLRIIEKYGSDDDVARLPEWLRSIGLSISLEGEVVTMN